MASPRLPDPLPRVERSGNGCVCSGEVDRDSIRDELERILASPVFRNSKRYSSLLRHVVERTLDGKPEELKERTIGVDVFGRAADYDTNADHVVRSVAGEVRRRLAQYYMEPGREGELRIELLTGSYVPQFRPATEAPPPSVLRPGPVPLAPASARRGWWRPRMLVLWGGLAVALLAGLLSARALRSNTPFERFWGPFLASPNMALLCVGGGGGGQQPAATDLNQPLAIQEFEHQPSRRMHVSDALALAGLAAMLQSHGKPYRMLNRAGTTSFRDLQSGPFVLIGGMNNEWTLRLTNDLRFGFEKQPNGARVVDRRHPDNTSWSFNYTGSVAQFRDFAIVSRIRDPQTEQTAVVVAGIGSWGTLAAAEFVTNPEHLKKLDAFAPGHWDQKNVQVVIATDVIRGSSGPPNVLATHFW